jgi:hypothetical protein
LVGKYEQERTLGRYRHKWEDNIKMDLKEMVYEAMEQDRDQWRALIDMTMILHVPNRRAIS